MEWRTMPTKNFRIRLNGQIAGLDRHLNRGALEDLDELRTTLTSAREITEKNAAPADGYKAAIIQALAILKGSKTYSYIDVSLDPGESIVGVPGPGWARVRVPGFSTHSVSAMVDELKRAVELTEVGLDIHALSLDSLRSEDYAGTVESRVFDIPDRLVDSVEKLGA